MRYAALVVVGGVVVACSGKNTAPVSDAGPDLATARDMPAEVDLSVPDASDGPPPFEERPIEGRWYAGDFHVHATGASNDAGEESTPERIKEVALERGLDFLVLTDHSNSTGSDTTTTEEDPELFNQGPEFPYWEKAAELSDDSFLMIDGNEMSPVQAGESPTAPTGHIGCYPRDLETFDPNIAFVDRPRGEVTGAQTIAQALEAGCFATLNHPFGPTPWIAFDWTSRDYEAMEIYNGGAGWDRSDLDAVRGWACDISHGKRTIALAGSDCHRVDEEPPGSLLDPPLAWPTTYVWSTALDWNELIHNLDARRVSVSDTGHPLELDAYDAKGKWLGLGGDEVAQPQLAWLRVRGRVENSKGEARVLRIVRIDPQACNDTRQENAIVVPEPNWEVVHEVELTEGETIDVAVAVTPEANSAYFAWLRPDRDQVIQKHGVGLTNPVYVVEP